jgi:hypothetical protein
MSFAYLLVTGRGHVEGWRHPHLLTSTQALSVCLSVLQHGPRVSLGCRSNEFLDHAKT